MRRVRLLLLYNELFFSCFGDESKLDTEEESGERFEASNWKKKIGMGDRDSGGGADDDDTPKNVNTTLNEVNE